MTTRRGVAPSTEDDPRPPADGRREQVRLRPFVAVAAVVGLLLLGAAGGMLITLPASSSPAVPAADSVDVGFAQDMTVHHQQAVAMAAWERDHTTDPVLHTLAYDIEATQTGQIGRMQGWLSLWNAAPLPLGGHMAWMAGEPGHDHPAAVGASGGVEAMPGMATEQELAALRSATGEQLDVLFLQLMLRHHLGGVDMLSYAAERATVPQVRNLAAQMLASQSAESEYLRSLLAERGGTPLPL
jgi:uncharacterized protein (DUF305 family)